MLVAEMRVQNPADQTAAPAAGANEREGLVPGRDVCEPVSHARKS